MIVGDGACGKVIVPRFTCTQAVELTEGRQLDLDKPTLRVCYW